MIEIRSRLAAFVDWSIFALGVLSLTVALTATLLPGAETDRAGDSGAAEPVESTG